MRATTTIKLLKFKSVLFLSLLLFLMSCAARKPHNEADLQIRYLDDYVIPKDFSFQGTKVGGLSDLDYEEGNFYTVVDLPSSPRIYQFSMPITHQQIDTICFEKVFKIRHKADRASALFWDSEGLVYDGRRNRFILSSEGSIKNQKEPFIAELDTAGNLLTTYRIPEYFQADTKKGLRNNGVFEGLDQNVDSSGIWVSTELPMKSDGPTVNLFKTKSPVRFTYFDKKNKTPVKQFAYRLDRLRKVPFLPFGMNGVSAILEYKPEQFLVLERAFSAGHGSHGFRVRLYQADARKATNTLNIKSLRRKIGQPVIPANKKLLFDFNTIRSKLSGKVIDNLEGIAFGPKLQNGHQSLIVIADNNFSSWTPELNQVILLEIIPR